MKQILKALLLIFICLIGFLAVGLIDDQEIFIESKESKTTIGTAVFNKIKFFQMAGKDVWMMNQSHHGFTPLDLQSWDRLAIIVDKTQSPKRARFYQLEPGPLEWREGLPQRPLKISCFLCHNNGPRNIRPNGDSEFTPIKWKDRFKISLWNLRMKLYGRVLADAWHDESDLTLKPPFRFRSPFENESLKVKTCVKCHQESGFLARGSLKRQQASTIQFMFESGQMPPLGFWLSGQEKKELELFFQGF